MLRTPVQTTLTLTSDTGQAYGADVRQRRFLFTHEQLFHNIPGFNSANYDGFEISLINASEQNTGTAGTIANTSRIYLLRVSTALPTPNRIIDDQTYVMGTTILSATANGYSKYIVSLSSPIYCRFNTYGEYEFIVSLSGGVTAANAAAITGATSYLPFAWMHTYELKLIPKPI